MICKKMYPGSKTGLTGSPSSECPTYRYLQRYRNAMPAYAES
jgi:hypothetical protein